MLNINVDLVQRVKVSGLFFLQFYKIITGTLLTLFIPQNCDDKICTLTENYENPELYHKMTLYWNMLTMFSFLITYVYELKRENWSIKYLDIDNNVSDNNLKSVIVKEVALDKQMDRLNKFYKNIVMTTMFLYFVNLCLTIKLLYNNYHSTSTISCFISFSLLVMMKLYNSFTVAYHSVKSDKMMSAYMSEFVSFNVLDSDYIKEKEDKELKQLEDNIPEDIDVSDNIPEDIDVSDNIDLEEVIPIVINDDICLKPRKEVPKQALIL